MPPNPQADSSRASVARRITVIGGTCLLAVLAGICAVMTVMLSKRAQERTVSWVDAKVESVAQSLDAYDQTAKLLVERFFKVFGDQFSFNTHLKLDTWDWEVIQEVQTYNWWLLFAGGARYSYLSQGYKAFRFNNGSGTLGSGESISRARRWPEKTLSAVVPGARQSPIR